MWCKQLDTTDVDETVSVKGCLGKLLHPRSRKRSGNKQTIRTEGPPVCMAKPSVKVSPSTQQYVSHEETKENDSSVINIVTNRQTRPRSKSKQSSIRGNLALSSLMWQSFCTTQTWKFSGGSNWEKTGEGAAMDVCPSRPDFFNFMQFSGKMAKTITCPQTEKSWIRHWYLLQKSNKMFLSFL